MTVIYICGKQRFLETGFWRVAEFCAEMKIDGKMCGMSSITNSKLFQPGFISTTLWTRCLNVYGRCLQAAWKQLETMFLLSEVFISIDVCMADFLHRFHWMISARNLMLQHGARQQNKEPNTATSTVASSQTSYLACFRVA